MPPEQMKFGTEREFETALAELKWIAKTKGRLTKSDFEVAAQKYSFPADFLKEGLSGLQFPRDYMISQSKWFPVVYVWNMHFRSLHYEYLKLTVNYAWYSALMIAVPFSILMFGIICGEVLWMLGFPLQNVALSVTPTTIGATIAISLWLASKRSDAKSKREEFMTRFKSEVPRKEIFYATISMTNRFIEKRPLVAKALASRLETDVTHVNLFRVGDVMISRKKKSRFWRIRAALSFLPGLKQHAEHEVAPVYLAENPELEYAKRMRGVLDSER